MSHVGYLHDVREGLTTQFYSNLVGTLNRSNPREATPAPVSFIDGGIKTFIEVGSALLEIRDDRLYRESYGTFDDYCRVRGRDATSG
jgi:hypothetical protein